MATTTDNQERLVFMNRFLRAVATLLIITFSTLGISQQALMQPEMTVHDLFGAEPRNGPREGLQIRFGGAAATIRMISISIEAGASTPNHNHPDEEMVLLLEGSIKAVSGDREFVLEPGEMFVVPAYVEHHYEALEDSRTVEVFGPGRSFGGPAGMGMGMGG